MTRKTHQIIKLKLDKIVGGGRCIATMDNGQKIFVWGGLPNEIVNVRITKMKAKLAEGVVTEIIKPSIDRIEPKDPIGFLSTSPWQIMNFKAEQKHKIDLIKEAFELQDIKLTNAVEMYSDGNQYNYRNKIEYSFWYTKETEELNLAFFDRGTHNKIAVEKTSLAIEEISQTAIKIRDLFRKLEIKAYDLKTMIIRCSQDKKIVAQIYVKNQDFNLINESEIKNLNIQGFEIIYSNPKSPASVITKRLQSYGKCILNDKILNIPFNYSVEGFFQINIPVYQQTLKDIKKWVTPKTEVIDLYSGVGTIGLTVSNNNLKLIEINEVAIDEMKNNIKQLGLENSVKAILAKSEEAVDYIAKKSTIIVDPPRVGIHEKLVDKILESKPKRIIYLSCNPITQARDISKLLEKYQIVFQKGYNYFPRTPHIENLIVMDLI